MKKSITLNLNDAEYGELLAKLANELDEYSEQAPLELQYVFDAIYEHADNFSFFETELIAKFKPTTPKISIVMNAPASCQNEIEQTVPTQFDVKIVKGRCGQTGIYGEPVFCQSCLDAGAMEQHQKREHDLKYNNY